jgi:hypothetical protein
MHTLLQCISIAPLLAVKGQQGPEACSGTRVLACGAMGYTHDARAPGQLTQP